MYRDTLNHHQSKSRSSRIMSQRISLISLKEVASAKVFLTRMANAATVSKSSGVGATVTDDSHHGVREGATLDLLQEVLDENDDSHAPLSPSSPIAAPCI